MWAVILLLWGILLSCQSAPETISRPDWADVTLYATGFGAIPKWTPEDRIRGIQAAKIGAARQLEEKMLLLTTDSGEPFREKVIKEKLMQKVSAYVREAEVVAIENKPEGVEILSRLSLGDPFKAALGLLKRKELSPPQRLQEGSY
ncbi:MAG: hypothetical protein HY201_01015 [Nitrospirae bacterium]|nr:hypothetical protein [Candidatus Troglogloeales bacterium]MBI3598031.1 hypothetical protein [Candidatus Troglogloeales bacterium]